MDVYVYEAGHDEAALRVEGLLAVRGCDGVGGANRGDARALDPDAVIRLEAIRGENGALAYEHAASLPVLLRVQFTTARCIRFDLASQVSQTA